MNFVTQYVNSINWFNKRKLLRYLQAMPQRQLLDSGFSPELLEQGVSAWPWREDKQYEQLTRIEQKLEAEKRGIKELQQYSDAELADLGISRGSIREVVRYGRGGIEATALNKAA